MALRHYGKKSLLAERGEGFENGGEGGGGGVEVGPSLLPEGEGEINVFGDPDILQHVFASTYLPLNLREKTGIFLADSIPKKGRYQHWPSKWFPERFPVPNLVLTSPGLLVS